MEKILKNTLSTGTFDQVNSVHSKMMSAIKSKGNKTTELNFKLGLDKANLTDWIPHADLIGKPDIFFPKYNIVIFLDGCFWHCCPDCGHVPKTNSLYWQTKFKRNLERDSQHNEILKLKGYTVIRFWEHEIKYKIDDCIMYVNDTIERSYYYEY